MRKCIIHIGAIALATAIITPLTSNAQLGSLTKLKPAAGASGAAAASAADLLAQLNPGAVLFSQAYAKYFEALGDTQSAMKMREEAEQLKTGGTITSKDREQLDGALKKVKELASKSELSSDEAKAAWKEGNKLYREGMGIWTLQSAAVAMAIKQDPTAVASNPQLALAAALCVKGLKDMSGYLEVAAAKAGEQKEIKKAEK